MTTAGPGASSSEAAASGVVRTSIYSGRRASNGRTFVSVDGRPLATRSECRKDSTTTFDWGYPGRGAPAQLAWAILADHLGDDQKARSHYARLVRRVIGGLPKGSWVLTGPEIDAALEARGL